MNKIRKVRIEEVNFGGKSWHVVYVDRVKGQHHQAAQFAAEMRTKDQVVEWVKTNPKLELVD